MSKPTHIYVTAAEGREVPVPPSEASAPGAQLLKCLPGKVYVLPNSTYTRRRLLSGDLLPCDRAGKIVGDVDQASAPAELGEVMQAATEATMQGSVAPIFDLTDEKPAPAPGKGSPR